MRRVTPAPAAPCHPATAALFHPASGAYRLAGGYTYPLSRPLHRSSNFRPGPRPHCSHTKSASFVCCASVAEVPGDLVLFLCCVGHSVRNRAEPVWLAASWVATHAHPSTCLAARRLHMVARHVRRVPGASPTLLFIPWACPCHRQMTPWKPSSSTTFRMVSKRAPVDHRGCLRPACASALVQPPVESRARLAARALWS